MQEISQLQLMDEVFHKDQFVKEEKRIEACQREESKEEEKVQKEIKEEEEETEEEERKSEERVGLCQEVVLSP